MVLLGVISLSVYSGDILLFFLKFILVILILNIYVKRQVNFKDIIPNT